MGVSKKSQLDPSALKLWKAQALRSPQSKQLCSVL